MESEANIDRNREIQQEIRQGRQLSLTDILAHEGGNFLKGESPVPKLVQVITEINLFIAQNLVDSQGALQAILQTRVKQDEKTVSRYLDTPLMALKEILSSLLNNDSLLFELVKVVDFKWGQMYGERPYFQKPGEDPHPDDEYTHESVKLQLKELLTQIEISLTEDDPENQSYHE